MPLKEAKKLHQRWPMIYTGAAAWFKDVKPLLADALMFAGRYQEAKTQFSEYLSATEEVSAEWRLKHWALNQILDMGVSTQVRATNQALALVGDQIDSADGLEGALRLDALCGLAWFNKGASALENEDPRGAAVYYLIAALCQSWDLEAWRNAFFLTVQKGKDPDLGPLILRSAYEIHKEAFLEFLVSAMQGPIGQTNEFIESCRQLLGELPSLEQSRKMRILGPGSEYISFDVASGTVRWGGGSESA